MPTVPLVRPDGCHLHVETHGDPASPPILLIEGMGGDLPGWSRTTPNLERQLFVIAYDQRGNGWSDAPDEPQTMTTFVDDALAVLDVVEVGRAHIYGQSFGAMAAIELALAYPQRVRSLIVAATHAGGSSVIRLRASVPKEDASLAIFSPSYPVEHPDGVRALFADGVPQSAHAQRRQWEAMQGYEVADRLGELTVPTLVMHGTEDRVISVDNGRFIADAIPGAELVLLEGAGHVYHWEQPEAADDAILDFVRRHR